MSEQRRFSGAQITTMVVAVSLAVIALPVGVMATAGTLVNIADPTASYKARVSSTGALRVGDGSGAITVDGTVMARPAIPANRFSVSAQNSGGVFSVKLGSGTVALTDIVLSHENSDHSRLNLSVSLYTDGGGGTCASVGTLLKSALTGIYIPAAQVTSVHFNSPIVGIGSPVCLRIVTGSNPGLFFSYTASGFAA